MDSTIFKEQKVATIYEGGNGEYLGGETTWKDVPQPRETEGWGLKKTIN